ncbi:MAG: hypothetical protein FWF44_02720 [Defluviitaleaceae bacterium]|nr:hypothetical protein [Defluviitaleaceae bacterium]
MRTKEEYYELVLENRRIAGDPELTKCPCRRPLCEWHGKCAECVALHRYHGDHVPVCLQPIIDGKIQALAGVAEMRAVKKEETPAEYRRYVRKREREGNG